MQPISSSARSCNMRKSIQQHRHWCRHSGTYRTHRLGEASHFLEIINNPECFEITQLGICRLVELECMCHPCSLGYNGEIKLCARWVEGEDRLDAGQYFHERIGAVCSPSLSTPVRVFFSKHPAAGSSRQRTCRLTMEYGGASNWGIKSRETWNKPHVWPDPGTKLPP